MLSDSIPLLITLQSILIWLACINYRKGTRVDILFEFLLTLTMIWVWFLDFSIPINFKYLKKQVVGIISYF